MPRTHNAQIYLPGVLLIPVGWVLTFVMGGRVAQPAYRSDEDLYTLLALVGAFLMLAGATLVLSSIFRALRKVDGIDGSERRATSRGSATPPADQSRN